MPYQNGQPPIVKCLVWDLDNTLWQGTLLEDSDVKLSAEIRDVIVALDSRGILQSIASKNDYDMAWRRVEELGIAGYFVRPQISWGCKSDSVRQIAGELNFAMNAIAFIDDQAAEIAEVGFGAPEVRCYAADQATSLPSLPEFSPAVVTADGRRHRQKYQASFRRTSHNRMMDIAYRLAGFTDDACACLAHVAPKAEGHGIQ